MIEQLIERIPFSGCWIFMGTLDKGGYGKYGHESHAHRYVYRKMKGPIPPRMLVCHTCDVRCCVNPDHLFLGDYQANMDDMWAKGRQNVPFGERCRTTKLTPAQVVEIRSIYKRGTSDFGLVALGKKYGVYHSTIGRIVNGHYWKQAHE